MAALEAQSAIHYPQAPAKVTKIGVEDTYGESGPAAELIHKYGLDAEGIYKKIKASL